MRKLLLTVSILSLGLSACAQEQTDQANVGKSGQAEEGAAEMAESDSAMSVVDVEEEAPLQRPAQIAPTPPTVVTPVEQSASAAQASDNPVDEPQGRATMPDFTYSYDYKFEAPSDELGRLQDAHMAACDAMGEQQCRLANYSQNLKGVGGTTASLELYVASGKVRSLADQMTNIARDFGGDRVEANIIGTNTTQRLDQAQLQVTNNLTEKERLQAIIDDPRANRSAKQAAAQQLAALTPRISQSQRQLDNVASELGFTKVDISYSSSSLFGPWVPYALIILLLAVIGGVFYRSKQVKIGEPVAA